MNTQKKMLEIAVNTLPDLLTYLIWLLGEEHCGKRAAKI